ncbi:hypothetical protein SAMN02745163_00805 [Clostridium cavendishii DSM 21758]|uniref:Iron-only hydrogenase system regulator n=1 Tax=Clostridium cavendishii DSM 21758 TaxID=1121302 RepID=A0A1M6EB49_9CLOT|nr:hypothetical protein [Clostridium cavendishii]SHI82518.1 hypothetical protein SAMN02745163_00805 [Clostridium cavendishii DSM 21758]
MFSVMAIKLSPRTSSAPKAQEILTKYGCIIKTRIGLHEASKDTCSTAGLILLDLLRDDEKKIQNLLAELNSIDNVTAKLLEI